MLDSTTALLLNVALHQILSVDGAIAAFWLQDFREELLKYARLLEHPTARQGVSFDKLKIWHKFRIQLSSVHCDDVLMPAETVQAFPPSKEAPYWMCDTVLIKDHASQSTTINAFHVVQVHLVFQALPHPNHPLPQIFNGPLAYVQYFKFAGKHDDNGLLMEERDVDMYLLRQHVQGASKTAVRGIISLLDIAWPVELIPVFGQSDCDRSLTSKNSLDIWDKYYLNNFSDKEVYATLLNEYNAGGVGV
ncbi:hypothetical protein DXG01_013095 [Tephrocybe rancida]|nr:hypothetical protein DXG01_013095 [Tephrocybe rancida]